MFLLIRWKFTVQRQRTRISIHLMFLLIGYSGSRTAGTVLISIHLMFLLITEDQLEAWIKQHFNTSHVSINPNTDHRQIQAFLISIHLMFLLIAVRCRRPCAGDTISIHLMFLLISLNLVSSIT